MAREKAKIGTAAGSAGILSFGSFALTCGGHPGWALIAGLLAVPCGALGFVWAALPSKRGGILSLVSIVVGVIAAVVALIALVV